MLCFRRLFVVIRYSYGENCHVVALYLLWFRFLALAERKVETVTRRVLDLSPRKRAQTT